jgi:hypothetical protein
MGTSAAAGEPEEHKAEGRLPLSYTERPLTLPRMILAPEGEFAVDHFDAGAGSITQVGIGLSARFGILDDLEAFALFAPIDFGPFPAMTGESQVHYGNPTLGATYRFLRGRFEVGATVGLTIVHELNLDEFASPAPQIQTGVILEPGAKFRFHITPKALLEGGVFLPIEFGALPAGATGNNVGAGLRVPLAFAYDIIEPFHVGVRTGVGIASFGPPPGTSVGENLYVPLGIFAGYAVGGKNGPILDIDPFFTWTALLTPGAQSHGLAPGDTVHPADISAGISLGGFLYF